MSDSVSNAKVEDVLASIRRLVSEERRPLGAADSVNCHTVAPPVATGMHGEKHRLILTPALRVSGPEPKHAVDQADADDASAVAGGSARDGFGPEEFSYDGDGAEQTDQEVANVGIPSPTEDLTEILRLDETARLPGLVDVGEHSRDHTQTGDEPTASEDVTPQAPERAVSAADDDRQRATHSVAGFETNEGESDGIGPPQPSGPEIAEDLAPGPAPEAAQLAQDDLVEAEPAEPGDGSDPGPEISTEPLVLEPEDRSDGHAEAEHDPEPADGSRAGPVELEALESMLGEAELRDLVSDIVRQELSGELGERITRNVRKLVRREIQRALATKEFD